MKTPISSAGKKIRSNNFNSNSSSTSTHTDHVLKLQTVITQQPTNIFFILQLRRVDNNLNIVLLLLVFVLSSRGTLLLLLLLLQNLLSPVLVLATSMTRILLLPLPRQDLQSIGAFFGYGHQSDAVYFCLGSHSKRSSCCCSFKIRFQVYLFLLHQRGSSCFLFHSNAFN